MVAAVFTISYNSKSKSGEKITVQTPKTKDCSEESEVKRKRRLWKNSKNRKLNHVYPEDMIKPAIDKSTEEGVTRTVGYVCIIYLTEKLVNGRVKLQYTKASKRTALHPAINIEM